MDKILVVDDEPAMCKLMRLITQDFYDVDTCHSVLQAKECLLKKKYKVVITDINMPGESGLTLVKYCQENYDYLPVIIITAHGDKELAKMALKDGAFDLIDKPFEDEEILSVLKKAILKRNEFEMRQGHDLKLRSHLINLDQLSTNGEDSIAARLATVMKGFFAIEEYSKQANDEKLQDKVSALGESLSDLGLCVENYLMVHKQLESVSEVPESINKLLDESLLLVKKKCEERDIVLKYIPSYKAINVVCSPITVEKALVNLFKFCINGLSPQQDRWIKIDVFKIDKVVHVALTTCQIQTGNLSDLEKEFIAKLDEEISVVHGHFFCDMDYTHKRYVLEMPLHQ